jgi:hypothetical protein
VGHFFALAECLSSRAGQLLLSNRHDRLPLRHASPVASCYCELVAIIVKESMGCSFCFVTAFDSHTVMGESTIFVEYQTVRRMISGDLKREMTAA